MTTNTLFDYFNDLWSGTAQLVPVPTRPAPVKTGVDDEHACLAVTVHTCTHAARLADLGRMEAVQADALQRLADLVAYTSRARTGGSAESVRLHQCPAEVVACVENYARDVIDLLAGDDSNT